jgi:uncharacterized membrane protein YhfC
MADGMMNGKKIFWFILGAACFIISQPLLRLPLLQSISQSTQYSLAYLFYPFLIGIAIALSAGIFEEGFRFLFKQFFLRPGACEFSQPIIFGLGHGIAEALYILLPALSIAPISQLGMAFLERALTIILHVTLTVVVWNGFQKKQRILYLIIAIVLHGLVDSLAPILLPVRNGVLWIEGLIFVIDLALIAYALYSRKYYISRRNYKNESEN